MSADVSAEFRCDISVVVPAYNVSEYLGAALKSLLQQTIPVQIVVVDDASTDDSADIVAAIAADAPAVTFVQQPANAGVAAAREAGVAAATGRFVWFVDADDEWPADAAATLLAAADRFGADVVCAGADYEFPDGSLKPVPSLAVGANVSGREAFTAMLTGRISGHLWNKLFVRRLFDEIEFTRSAIHSDQAMVAQLLAAAQTVIGIGAAVYRYRLRSGSVIRSGTQRAVSLEAVGGVVLRTAGAIGLSERDPDLAYYQARFSLLSRIKDATSGAYPAGEQRILVRRIRGDMSPAVFVALARRRDLRRLAMLVTARLNLPVYRAMMTRLGGRV